MTEDITFGALAARYAMQPYELAAFLDVEQRADDDDASDLATLAAEAVASNEAHQ